MSFAEAETRANASVFKALANALAVHTPGVGPAVEFPVVFDAAGGVIDEFGVVAQVPQLAMQPVAYTALEEGMTLVIRKNDAAQTPIGSYVVRSVMPQAEGGWQRVTLARG